MTTELWAEDEALVKRFVTATMGGPSIPAGARAVGLVDTDTGHIVGAAVLYPRSDGIEAEMAMIVKPGAQVKRRHVTDFLDAVYHDIGLRRLSMRIPRGNAHAWKRAERVGFQREGVARSAAPDGDDVMLYAMLASDRRL